MHLSAQTYKAIANQSPYLTDKNKATGGGDVPTLEWRIWGDEMKDQESEEERNGFDVCGVNVVPLKGELAIYPIQQLMALEQADPHAD